MAKPYSTSRLILASLRRGRKLTTESASRQFGITRDGVRARISELKKAGYCIYSNKVQGQTTYRLGAPKRRVIAAGNLVLTDPYFKELLGNEIDRNLSLV